MFEKIYPMNYLIYISTAIRLFNDDELKEILMKSQENNLKNGLTGMLLYAEGSFVQLLEGEADQLNETYEKIKADKRHKNLSKLDEGKTDSRSFPEWTMGYKLITPTDMSEFKGYVDASVAKQWDEKGHHPALIFLKSFADINNL